MKVKVPATSANMGPGFDVLGLALNLYNTFRFSLSDESKIIERDEILPIQDNLIYLSYKKTFQKFNMDCIPAEITVESNIPRARGLGSSSSCIVGGIVGAYLIMNKKIDKNEILQIAAEFEGHPDNVASAIFGNVTATLNKDGVNKSLKIVPKNHYKFLALVPDFELSTKSSREILSNSFEMKDITFNCSRVAFLISSLIYGEDDYLKIGLEDNIHQKYRGKLIPDYTSIMTFLKSRTLGSYLSGAGPTIMAIVKNTFQIKKELYDFTKDLELNWEVLELELDNVGFKIEGID
ncbi:homoserine kinase [Peptoniphilus olsenii]|uniref:Homoserine kinase n=1 Tax=Peptoniphilus olsenii TaxID=411570 RepID=A0ABV2J7M9_9FIRM